LLGGLKLSLLHVRVGLDVVHVHNMPDILICAALIPRLSGSKVVLDIHDPMAELFLSWNHGASSKVVAGLLRLQEKISCALADRVVSVNETMRENLRDKGVADDSSRAGLHARCSGFGRANRSGPPRSSAGRNAKGGPGYLLPPRRHFWRPVFLDQDRRIPDPGSSRGVATDLHGRQISVR